MNKATYTVVLYLCIALQLVNHLLYTQECYNNQIALLILIIIAAVVYGSYRKYKKAIKTVVQNKINPYPFCINNEIINSITPSTQKEIS